MKISIIKTVCGTLDDVKLPVCVEANTEGNFFKVNSSELSKLEDSTIPNDGFEYFFPCKNCEIVTDEPIVQENDVTLAELAKVNPVDITNKCCNQFGERDEMQSIINSLQADVIARGARIADLELKVKELQRRLDHNAQL